MILFLFRSQGLLNLEWFWIFACETLKIKCGYVNFLSFIFYILSSYQLAHKNFPNKKRECASVVISGTAQWPVICRVPLVSFMCKLEGVTRPYTVNKKSCWGLQCGPGLSCCLWHLWRPYLECQWSPCWSSDPLPC